MSGFEKYKIEAAPVELQREIEQWILDRQGRFLHKLSAELKARGIAIGACALKRYALAFRNRRRAENMTRNSEERG